MDASYENLENLFIFYWRMLEDFQSRALALRAPGLFSGMSLASGRSMYRLKDSKKSSCGGLHRVKEQRYDIIGVLNVN